MLSLHDCTLFMRLCEFPKSRSTEETLDRLNESFAVSSFGSVSDDALCRLKPETEDMRYVIPTSPFCVDAPPTKFGGVKVRRLFITHFKSENSHRPDLSLSPPHT